MNCMKHLFRWMTLAAVLAGGFTFAAENTAGAKDAAAPKADAGRRAAGNERAKLTPEERAKLRKEATEKRAAKLKELKAKKAAGTLTDKEQQQLDRLEKAAGPRAGGRRQEAPKTEGAAK